MWQASPREKQAASLENLAKTIAYQKVVNDDILKEAFQNGKTLGEGIQGEARLCGKWVIKRFKDRKARAREERVHMDIWKRMQPGCRKYICRPYKVQSTRFTLQRVAEEDGWNSEPLSQLSDFYERVKPELKRAILCLRRAGYVHNDIEFSFLQWGKWYKEHNNVILLWRGKEGAMQVTVKLIDFGLSSRVRLDRMRPRGKAVTAAPRV